MVPPIALRVLVDSFDLSVCFCVSHSCISTIYNLVLDYRPLSYPTYVLRPRGCSRVSMKSELLNSLIHVPKSAEVCGVCHSFE